MQHLTTKTLLYKKSRVFSNKFLTLIDYGSTSRYVVLPVIINYANKNKQILKDLYINYFVCGEYEKYE